jgi:hypothetical protein
MSCDRALKDSVGAIAFSKELGRCVHFDSPDDCFAAIKGGSYRVANIKDVAEGLYNAGSTMSIDEAKKQIAVLAKMTLETESLDRRGASNPLNELADHFRHRDGNDELEHAVWEEIAHSPELCADALFFFGQTIESPYDHKIMDNFLTRPTLVLEMLQAKLPNYQRGLLRDEGVYSNYGMLDEGQIEAMHYAVSRGATPEEAYNSLATIPDYAVEHLDRDYLGLLWRKIGHESPSLAERALQEIEDGDPLFLLSHPSGRGGKERVFYGLATGPNREFLKGFPDKLKMTEYDLAGLRIGIEFAPCGFYNGYEIADSLPPKIQELVREHQELSTALLSENPPDSLPDMHPEYMPGMSDQKAYAWTKKMQEDPRSNPESPEYDTRWVTRQAAFIQTAWDRAATTSPAVSPSLYSDGPSPIPFDASGQLKEAYREKAYSQVGNWIMSTGKFPHNPMMLTDVARTTRDSVRVLGLSTPEDRATPELKDSVQKIMRTILDNRGRQGLAEIVGDQEADKAIADMDWSPPARYRGQ